MSEINVLYPFDNNYAPYAGISLTSLLANNTAADSIHIYTLGFDLSDENISLIRSTVEDYNRDITFIDPSSIDEYIKSLDMPSYRGARIAVARLFVTRFIPDDVKRLIYLDSDTLVTGDLNSLIDSDLSGMPVGMVCDSVARDYKLIMGFGSDEEYYNGGMILYDLGEWKNRKCTDRIIEHITHVRKNYEALDQDLINIVLKNEIYKLNPKYNFQPFHLVYPADMYLSVYGNSGYYSEETLNLAKETPAILHAFRYLGMFPWHKNSLHPYTNEFFKFKAISKWKDMPAVEDNHQPLVIRIERVVYYILPKRLFLHIFRAIFKFSMMKIEKHLQSEKKYKNI